MRLTKKYEDGSFGVADNLQFGENSYDFKNLLIKTLGQYEDSVSSLGKEEFCKHIFTIEQYFEKMQKFSDALLQMFDALGIYTADDGIVGSLITMLEHVMGDNEQWISYFIYDCNFGKDDREIEFHDKVYVLKTSEDLYNFLLNYYC